MREANAEMGEKLLDRMRRVIRTRHYSYRTDKSYLGWARRYIFFHGKQHPARLGKEAIEAFLSHLAVDRHVAPSTQNQVLRHKAPKSPLRPDRQFIPIRICKVKPPSAGEFEDLFDDLAAGLQYHFKLMFQFAALEHDQRAAGGGVGGLVGLVESAVEPRLLK